VSVTITPVGALPAGTVTLLFADVEGSTRLLNLLGERFGPARARMRELVREAARDHGGFEVDWAGDGVFLAFPRARDGVAAAAQIHRSLAAEPWPDEAEHRLRIGVHTGEPELGVEGYVGIDVVIASRICGAAHGEQVVVSQATRDVSGDEPLPGASYRPLGRHRLKDVPSAAHLFQLVAPALREDFPPLKTLTATSLPALHHRLVGRADALARVESLLEVDGARLVTITGPGGAGKSRLALEIAARAAVDRPVHLVGLAPISDADLVPSAIARALGVREPRSQTVLDAVADQLGGSSALLYLDNLEQLAGVSAQIGALLDRVPDLQILATSRTPLRLSVEHLLPLEPLTIEHATTLFMELAAARGVVLRAEALDSVHEICRRLDGLPLAIELVAARLVVLPPAEIVRALEEGLALEMEGPIDLPERQRTLRAAIDWSYRRLTETQRLLHGTLAVFSDSASLDDARALASSPATFLADLEALVGWSLVRSEAGDGTVRLSMLETVREHALGELEEQGVLTTTRARHAERFLELSLSAEAALAGADQAVWFAQLEVEFDNLRSAIDWLLTHNETEAALRAISALERFWAAHGHLTDARRWLAHGLAETAALSPDVRARALWTAAREAMLQSDYAVAIPALEEALVLFRKLEDSRYAVFALCELARARSSQEELEHALRDGEEALTIAEAAGDERATSAALDTLAMVEGRRGDRRRAQELSARSLALRRTLGDPLLIVSSANTLGLAAMRAGDLDTAARAFEECLQLARNLGEKVFTAAALCGLGEIALTRESAEDAADRLVAALALYRELENDRDVAECLHALGGVAAVRGRARDAAHLWGAADARRKQAGAALTPEERAVDERLQSAAADDLGPSEYANARMQGRVLDDVALDTIVSDLGSSARRE